MDQHRELLALAGRAPDGWLVIAREALADDDTARLTALLDVLPEEKTKSRPYTFAPEPGGYEKADRTLVAAVRTHAAACWATTRDGSDRVYLVQATEDTDDTDLPSVAAAGQKALARLEDTPKVEVFGPDTELPDYHERALLAATLLWSATPGTPVHVARAFDGAGVRGPWFAPDHELVVDPAERGRLLEFLAGGEVVLAANGRLTDVLSGAAGAVPAGLRSDGTWVWSDASGYYLDRYQLAPDPELAVHAMATEPAGAQLSPLVRHHVRVALNPTDQEDPTWRG
ncbi:hypothetical protein [Actinophytocola algeriensis]|uniref:Uncharacterized protein n=1 Tax=Actinophytocola algeriensis TaxID=1768010 RepID=A0A7W7Q2G3_9PSEU|nr:hypothetical protein [Actinophytocola algeriensis]MBB4905784.1 hypothetical protein [Actinophytocola algeriensis]MBE1472531.1 hypothetical protein [Actinophytocola algeriensis]